MPSEALPGLAEFCADLAELRKQCGNPSLKWLEERVGYSDTHISDILNGKKTGPPTWDFVAAYVPVCAEHARRNGHHPHLSTDIESWRQRHGLLESPPPAPSGPNPWAELVAGHVVWRHAAEADHLRERTAQVAGRLWQRRRRAAAVLRGDSWLDDAFVVRMTERLAELLESVIDSALDLSAAEAALMALAPVVHQTRAAVLAERLVAVGPTDLRRHADADPLRQDYQRFLTGREQSRLAARTGDAEDIAWWLFHRWADSHPNLVDLGDVLDDRLVGDKALRVMLTGSLERIVRLFRLPPESLRDTDRRKLKARIPYSGVTVKRQVVREDLIGLVLAVAHTTAIELTGLSSTLVEHLGIPTPVRLDELRATLDEAEWDFSARTRVHLVASCRHEAVYESLREHVERTDVMLGAIRAAIEHGAYLDPLADLPARAYADRVEPAVVGRKPAFVVPVTRLRLDESRVRELLMGEQLYRDRSLAIRELYQNALDACRYAKARLEYLEKTSDLLSRWEGRITFKQGVDETGRHYLSCSDNGIGMRESELREVFSQAGVRFADQPEFLEEKARWAKVGVPFHPNSRFGIGVLSYFMLADEIEVTTSRMDTRGDNPGPVLRVSIVGPGHLFRIEHLDDRVRGQGTTVKLYLRDGAAAPSCVDVLQRLLGIAEFHTTAEHDGPVVEWESTVFTIPPVRPTGEGIDVGGVLVPSKPGDGGQVIWCERGGALLVDGVYVGFDGRRGAQKTDQANRDLRGAVVNLTGHRVPRLTVDRRSVFGDVWGHVEFLLNEAAEDLLGAEHSALDFDWLCEVAEESPAVADVVTTAAVRHGRRMTSGTRSIDLSSSGCFPLDRHLIGELASDRPHVSGLVSFPPHLALWRLMANTGQGGPVRIADGRGPLPALPSDHFLLQAKDGLHRFVESRSIPPGHVLAKASALDRAPRRVARRLHDLGFDVGDLDRFSGERGVDPIDVNLLSHDSGKLSGWLRDGKRVPFGHVVAAHLRTGRAVREVVERLRHYSLDADVPSTVSRRLSTTDQVLLSVRLDGRLPWLERDEAVPMAHAYRAALLLRLSVRTVADRLVELGFEVEPGNLEPDWLAGAGSEISQLLDLLVWEAAAAVSPVQVLGWARASGMSPREVCRVLEDLGFEVPAAERLPDDLGEDDLALVPEPAHVRSTAGGGEEVSVPHVLAVSARSGLDPVEVADRLAALGYEVPAMAALRRGLDQLDQALLDGTFEFVLDRVPEWRVIHLAATTHRAPAEVAERLVSLGAQVSEVARSSHPLTAVQRKLVAADDRLATWMVGATVPLAHALHVAKDGPWTVGEAIEGLAALGYSVRNAESADLDLDSVDFDLLDRVNTTGAVNMLTLVRQALWFELPLHEVAARLERMGMKVPDLAVELPELLEQVPWRRD